MPTALLTGATGLIGGEICRLLLDRGWDVRALVRRDAPICGNDGQMLASSALTRVAGDIGQPACGLDRAMQDRLERDVDLVLHCAASTAFNASEEHHHRTNVAGTAHMLELCGRSPFLYVSTAYVCGQIDGPVAELACPPNSEFANGYERSKARAEALVEQSGRPWLIARPAIVVGAAADGRIRRFDSIYSAFKLLAEGRVKAIPATANASLGFVPIDHVALALAALAGRYQNFDDQHVHICPSQPLAVADFVAAIGSYPRLTAPRLAAPADFDEEQLPRMEKMLLGRMLKPYLPYFQRNPQFATGRLERITGLQSPVVDQAFLHTLIGFAVAAGFLRTPLAQP